MTAHKFTF